MESSLQGDNRETISSSTGVIDSPCAQQMNRRNKDSFVPGDKGKEKEQEKEHTNTVEIDNNTDISSSISSRNSHNSHSSRIINSSTSTPISSTSTSSSSNMSEVYIQSNDFFQIFSMISTTMSGRTIKK